MLNFSLTEMTFLRYFIPITIVGNRYNLKSTYYIQPNQKYNSPHLHKKHLYKLSQTYNFNIKDVNSVDNSHNTFLIEGCGREYFPNNKKLSITYMTDFQLSYKQYINEVDHVIFPSKYIAEHYKCISDKNLYLGSPKYDFISSEQEIRDKLNLHGKYALIIFPKSRDLSSIDLKRFYSYIRDLGYKIIVKTRGKDHIPDSKLNGDHTFVDGEWFPHNTLELIKISDFVLNFGSTATKECVMLNKKMININIKPYTLGFPFLYETSCVLNMKPDIEEVNFKTELLEFLSKNMYNVYKEVKEEYLFEDMNVCENMLKHLRIIT
jgi:hypothetical protein